MNNDPHYYALLGWIVSWIVFPGIALQAFLRYRKTKKRIDIAIGVVCVTLFALKVATGHY